MVPARLIAPRAARRGAMAKNGWSQVERDFLVSSGRQESYANEKIPVIEVQNIYDLGDNYAYFPY